jgi:hypothetical protein
MKLQTDPFVRLFVGGTPTDAVETTALLKKSLMIRVS